MNHQSGLKRKPNRLSQRRIAILAGFSLLAMMAVAIFSNFLVFERLVDPSNALSTLNNLTESRGLFTTGVAGITVVLLLDLVVAGLLYLYFRSEHKKLSAITAAFRILYAAVFALAIAHLVQALTILGRIYDTRQAQADDVLANITAFNDTWSAGYLFIGVHLILLAILIFKDAIPKWIGLLVAIAGLGYLFDAVGKLVSETYSLEIGMYTFIGELIFMVWLLIKGGTDKKIKVNKTTEN